MDLSRLGFNIEFKDSAFQLGLYPAFYETPVYFPIPMSAGAVRDFNLALAWVFQSSTAEPKLKRLSTERSSLIVPDAATSGAYLLSETREFVSTGYPTFIANRMLKRPGYYVMVQGLAKEPEKPLQTKVLLLWQVDLDVLNRRVTVTPIAMDFEGMKVSDEPSFILGIEDNGGLVPLK